MYFCVFIYPVKGFLITQTNLYANQKSVISSSENDFIPSNNSHSKDQFILNSAPRISQYLERPRLQQSTLFTCCSCVSLLGALQVQSHVTSISQGTFCRPPKSNTICITNMMHRHRFSEASLCWTSIP